jgi:hypothetical protein
MTYKIQFVPHRKHIKSPLQSQPVNAVYCENQSQSHMATDGQSISKSRWGSWPDIYYTLTAAVLFSGAPSLTRGRVCLLYMLLALASVVFLGSESLGTPDHILLSQIWDFPFRRLLRLAGSRWRYSNPSPHWFVWTIRNTKIYKLSLYLTGNTLRHRYKAQPVNAV